MTIFRYSQDAYGQDVLLGASWELILWLIGAAVVFSVLHAIYKRARRKPDRPVTLAANEVSQRIMRHKLSQRLYHWLLAVAVMALLVTAIGPHLGWRFHWLTIHWTAGIILCCLIVYHIVRALGWQDRSSMLPNEADFRHLMAANPAGKYELLQKVYHWGTAGLVVLLIATGAAMLSKINTPLWWPNPYWLSDSGWGGIYVIHDLAAMCLLALVIVHVYFTLRPDNFWMLRSMARGWITKEEYLCHHDLRIWKADEVSLPSHSMKDDNHHPLKVS